MASLWSRIAMSLKIQPYPKDLLYRANHAWVKIEGNIATVGLTSFNKIYFEKICKVHLPLLASDVNSYDKIGEIEGPAFRLPFFSPLPGIVVEVNQLLKKNPGLVMSSPYHKGWIMKLDILCD